MKIMYCISVLTIATVMISSASFAAGQGKTRAACKADAHSFCGDVKPGGGRIVDCLQEHYREISDECYAAIKILSAHGTGSKGTGDSLPPTPDDYNDNGKEGGKGNH